MKERVIDGFSGYAISIEGVVYLYVNGEVLHDISPQINNSGYARVALRSDDGKQKHMLVHRLVALAYIDNPKGLATVNHIDGDKTNNHVDNLEWMSLRDNIYHYKKSRG